MPEHRVAVGTECREEKNPENRPGDVREQTSESGAFPRQSCADDEEDGVVEESGKVRYCDVRCVMAVDEEKLSCAKSDGENKPGPAARSKQKEAEEWKKDGELHLVA